MTTSPDNNRLDRIERMLEAIVITVGQNSQQIEANSRQIEANSKQIEANSRKTEEIDRLIETNTRENAELRSAVNSLVQIVEVHQANFEVIVTEMRQIHAEIRGLQTENRRILDHLFGEQGEGE